MNDLKAAQGKVIAYGLVRDHNGRPVFDDIDNIDAPIWAMLTAAEKKEIMDVRNTRSRR
jgi:hypothetical protein